MCSIFLALLTTTVPFLVASTSVLLHLFRLWNLMGQGAIVIFFKNHFGNFGNVEKRYKNTVDWLIDWSCVISVKFGYELRNTFGKWFKNTSTSCITYFLRTCLHTKLDWRECFLVVCLFLQFLLNSLHFKMEHLSLELGKLSTLTQYNLTKFKITYELGHLVCSPHLGTYEYASL